MAIKIIYNIVNMKIIGKTIAKSANNLKPTTEATDKHFLSLCYKLMHLTLKIYQFSHKIFLLKILSISHVPILKFLNNKSHFLLASLTASFNLR